MIARPLRHPHDREILRLAVPALGALVAEPLFLLTDTAIVGRLGTEPLAGLGVAATVLTTAVSLCIFLAYGTTAAVARRIGAGDEAGALAVGVDGTWLALATGGLLAVAGLLTAPTLIDAMGASAAISPYAVTYLRISLLGIPAMLVVFAATGVLRGLQDTRTPLVVSVAAALLNAALSALLVLVLDFGIAGSAWGTVITQWLAVAAYLAVIVPRLRAAGTTLRFHRGGVLLAARAGWHLLVRTALLRAVLVTATAVAAHLGDAEVAAYAVAFGVWSLLALALDALAIAGQAITGRYLGAGDAAGTRAATRRMIEWGVAAGLVLGGAVAILSPVLPVLFSSDARVRDLLTAALLVVAVLQPIAGVVFVLDGVLIGAGDFRYLAFAGVPPMLAFLAAAALVLVAEAGLVALWLALAVFMLGRLAVLLWRLRGSAWLVLGI